jgi:hypothetical protein
MLEIGQWIAVVLLLIWSITAAMVIAGKARTPQFAAISTVMTLFIPFFWLSGEITELTISRVGSLKTNLQDANRYLEQVKTLKEQLEPQVYRLQNEMERASEDITNYKTNLGRLGNANYEIEVVDGGPTATACELGSVVVGVRRGLDNKLWITCSSLGRAVWTPGPTTGDVMELK